MDKDDIRSTGEIKMKAGIKSFTVNGFKGFGNEITIDFTRKAKNLVLYGENGSGKTSLIEALKILYDSSVDEIDLEKYKNIFAGNSMKIKRNSMKIKIRTEYKKDISLKTKNERRKDERGKVREVLVASPKDYETGSKTYLEAIAKSTTILSYRELMRIYDIRTGEDFYAHFVKKIMAHYLIPPRYETSLIQELEDLEILKKSHPKAKKRIQQKEKTIKDEINKIFWGIKDKWNEYIRKLTGDDIEVECSIEKIGSLDFKIKWNGKDVRNIMNYLNEGRLNAVALGLFLSYYKKFNTSPYKLLLLDDVVIGLDMNLRLPLLEILKEDFEDEYQVIMTTFDENWFNLMKNYLDGSKWEFKRLIVRKTDNNSHPFVIALESSDYLEKAEKYHCEGDIPAAALYTRLEFEKLVSEYAEKKNLEIKFRRRISEIPINEIWNKVGQTLRGAKKLCKRIDTYKSILLNPSVHYDQRPKYSREVKYAIDVVKKLRDKIKEELNNKNV